MLDRRGGKENVLFHRIFIIMRQFEEAYVKTNILNGFYEMHIEIIKNVLWKRFSCRQINIVNWVMIEARQNDTMWTHHSFETVI